MSLFGRLAAGTIVLTTAVLVAGERRGQVVRVKITDKEVEGTPLHTSASQVVLLARDGAVWDIDPRQVQSFSQTTRAFESLSLTSLSSQLAREFGDPFEVTSAGKFLVVHPRGHGKQWARRFDELYRSFRHYFSVRGFSPTEPEFPLVAIVLRSRAEFDAHKRRDKIPSNVLGYYSPTSNRVVLYDVTEGDDDAWKKNAETIIHEATHQTAFNTGIHNRLRPTPRWVVEGLGTMFESRGVWDSRTYPREKDRINWGRLSSFRSYLQRRPEDALAEIVSSDRPFQTEPDGAYAEAWALTFFLVETRPREYAKFLKLTCGQDFEDYTATQRLTDFHKVFGGSVFGGNLKLLDAQFLQFVQKLRE